MNIFTEFTIIGRICRTTDRGFAFVSTGTNEHFVHIYNHDGPRIESLADMQERYCVLVLGGDPRAYSEHKPDWTRQAVRWHILHPDFQATRRDDFATHRTLSLGETSDSELRQLLAADWYLKKWHRTHHAAPTAPLCADAVLEECLHSRLAGAEDFDQLVCLLAAICTSPWFTARGTAPRSVFEQFFKPHGWPRRVFQRDRPLANQAHYQFLLKHCGAEFDGWLRQSRVVAIDLESDGHTIHEYGWKALGDAGRRKDRAGLEGQKLQDAVDASLGGLDTPCVVGHNLLAWDWPLLERHAARFPRTTERWDTLLGSWLLQPWLASHALIVAENAHIADADASECFDLFEYQARCFSHCLADGSLDIHKLVDRLFTQPAMLDAIDGREFPSTLHATLPGPTLFPSFKKKDFAWQQDCLVEFLTPERRYQDPVLDPSICRAIAVGRSEINAKAISAVVENATSQGVAVHLSWIPRWLAKDDLLEALRDAHADAPVTVTSQKCTPIYIAEDLFELEEEELLNRLGEAQLSVTSPEHVALAWQRARRTKLRDDQVAQRFPEARTSRRGRTLLAVDDDGSPSWLLNAPSGLGSSERSWYRLPTLPDWMRITPSRDADIQRLPVRLPRWRDGDAARLDVDRLFVSPDTANRPLYLADLTHAVLNVSKATPSTTILLVGLHWREESEILQRHLSHLGVSSEHPGAPLRRLESLLKKGHSVLCCEIEDVPQYVEAAQLLEVDLDIAVDALPLHEWHAILESPQDHVRTEDQDADAPDEDMPRSQDVSLRGPAIRTAVQTFLEGWLDGLGLTQGDATKHCLILDARLTARHAATVCNIAFKDIPFFELGELLDAPTLELFHRYCYPPRGKTPVPKDYESYRRFLEANWGYPDFRPGTQKPAIRRIIESEKDLLLRLPTGEGKSIVFHLPALLRSGYTGRLNIVITPLRALMRDQVEGLWRRRFIDTVDFLSGDRDPWLNHEVYQGVLDGRIQLLFIAPERLRAPRFREVLERRRLLDGGLEFIVFDEAHCVSEWGFDFRPDYLHAAQYVRREFKELDRPGNPHRLLLTSATVTERNRSDLEHELSLGSYGVYDNLPEDMPHPIQSFIEIESFDLDEDREAPTDEKFDKICEIIASLDLTRSSALLFARSRKDCHRLSEALNARATEVDSALAGLRALPFHAGLSESLKTEACDLLRARRANVLVCTKAFGMGMDIPHIHACIHQKPPTFIEDYLQEVGRVGRDQGERIESGHELVTASLLYNAHDIEQNLSMLHEKTVQPPDLAQFFNYCVNSAVLFEPVGRAICLVPATLHISDTLEYDESQVTSCLFWLERMDILKVEGRQPPILDLVLRVSSLERHARGNGLTSRIATVLIDLAHESHDTTAPLARSEPLGGNGAKAESAFGRVVRGLVRGVLSLLSKPRIPPSTRHPRPTPAATDPFGGSPELEMSVPVRELLARSGDISSDDLHTALFELAKARAIDLKKTFLIRSPEQPSEEAYLDLLAQALDRLCTSTEGRVEILSRESLNDQLREWYRGLIVCTSATNASADAGRPPTQLEQWRIDREVHRAVRTSLKIMRQSGFALKEHFSEDGVAEYARSIPTDLAGRAARSAREAIRRIRVLSDIIRAIEPTTLEQRDGRAARYAPLTYIVDQLGGTVRVSELRETMTLLDASGLFSFESDSDEWVAVVTLNHTDPLPPHTPDDTNPDIIQRVYGEMLGRFAFQTLRAQSMALLAAMPRESRKQFIDEYFACIDASQLETLLEDTIGEVDDAVVQGSTLLRNLLSQVRQQRFTEEIDRLDDDQRQACETPYDRTLLVNAGPGSGKTHVLMMRCAHLIHNQRIDPSSILVLAFNRTVVYEIRERLRKLFRELGYSSYARRVDVTTFHSFAMRFRHPDDRFEEASVTEAVHSFAEAIREDPALARTIGSRYRAVLIDEFQDMNEDFFDVVEALISHCNGGGMVIGDDDQDILTWNRVAWRNTHGTDCPMEAVHYFTRLRDSLDPVEVTLTANYRSTPQVVERANAMIEHAAAQIGFPRMKAAGRLRAVRTDAGIAAVKRSGIDCPRLVADAVSKDEHVAILCRSNRECREIYETLTRQSLVVPDQVELLGAEDFSLYQLRATGGLLDICQRRKDYEFVESYIWSEMMDEFRVQGYADMPANLQLLDIVYTLVHEEAGRPRIRDFKDFILEMRGSDVERLQARIGIARKRSRLTIATVHKVKGLEYDTLIALPSKESFPFGAAENSRFVPLGVTAAEEARLYYVAMTRAKNRLYAGWGSREQAWWTPTQYVAERGGSRYSLTGSPKEIWVSLAAQEHEVESGWQEYIKTQVSRGEPLQLRGRQLTHRGRPVGAISTDTAAKLGTTSQQRSFRVANVIRYSCGPYFREHNQMWWDKLHEAVKRQGWFYVVLVEEA